MLQVELAPSAVIADKYVVERTLGRGGMGAVYVVSHAQTGKRLAMKTLLPELVHDGDLVGRFLREAQVMGRLNHRHVVDVFDVGRDGDVLFIVMELLDGKPLGELLKDETLGLEETLTILLRAMEGVSAAHDQGVVHRDLKPDNIFVCVGPSGRLDDPKVLDFGISKLDDPAGQNLTRSGVAMGTPYYMAIEQLNGQRDLDARVDVYAMGVILYEALAGEPPFVADSMSALAIRMLTTEPLHLTRLRPDLPEGLADLVMRAVARNRDERPRSMRALIEALRPFVARSHGLTAGEGQGRPLRTPRAGQPRVEHPATATGALRTVQGRPASRGLKWVVVLALAVALLGAIVTVLLRDGAGSPRPAAPHARPAALPQPATDAVPTRTGEPSRPAPAAVEAVERKADPVEPTQATSAQSAPSQPTPSQPTPTQAAIAEPPKAQASKAEPAPVKAAQERPSPGKVDAEKRKPKVRAPGRPRPEIAAQAPTRDLPKAPDVQVAPPPPAGQAARSKARSAEGRAGKLGSDEF